MRSIEQAIELLRKEQAAIDAALNALLPLAEPAPILLETNIGTISITREIANTAKIGTFDAGCKIQESKPKRGGSKPSRVRKGTVKGVALGRHAECQHVNPERTEKGACKECKREYMINWRAKRAERSVPMVTKPLPSPVKRSPVMGSVAMVPCDECGVQFSNAILMGQHKTRDHYGSTAQSIAPSTMGAFNGH